jgi:hypothetical protein
MNGRALDATRLVAVGDGLASEGTPAASWAMMVRTVVSESDVASAI